MNRLIIGIGLIGLLLISGCTTGYFGIKPSTDMQDNENTDRLYESIWKTGNNIQALKLYTQQIDWANYELSRCLDWCDADKSCWDECSNRYREEVNKAQKAWNEQTGMI
ncbi:MAG: hypothetical protein ABID38_04880 [Candidatus Diapherotrites archaeon]